MQVIYNPYNKNGKYYKHFIKNRKINYNIKFNNLFTTRPIQKSKFIRGPVNLNSNLSRRRLNLLKQFNKFSALKIKRLYKSSDLTKIKNVVKPIVYYECWNCAQTFKLVLRLGVHHPSKHVPGQRARES